jgi:hypothetical protein
MKTISNDQSALAYLNAEIERAQQAAEAEAAFDSVNGRGALNPWANAARALTDLEQDRRQLSLRIEGEKLSKAYADLRSLDEELRQAEQERQSADQVLKEQSEHPTIVKWKDAGSIARRHGFGHTFVLYSNWILTGKSRHYAPEGILYLEQHGPAELRFSEEEQKAVRAWAQTKDASDQALLKWGSVRDRREQLLRDWPQLKTAS